MEKGHFGYKKYYLSRTLKRGKYIGLVTYPSDNFASTRNLYSVFILVLYLSQIKAGLLPSAIHLGAF